MSVARLFIGIPLDLSLCEKVAQWRSLIDHIPVRWVALGNLHITLIPPWEELHSEEAVARFHAWQPSLPSFEITFRRITVGPRPESARLIWATGSTPPALVDIRRNIADRMNTPLDARPYMLHMTLCRFDHDMYTRLPFQNLDESISWTQRVHNVVLYRSHLLSHGAEYEILAHASLQ